MPTGKAMYVSGSADTNAGPSPGVWKDCPWSDIQIDPRVGFSFFDDFVSRPFTVPTTEANFGSMWKGFSSSGGLMSEGGEVGGTFLIGDATDDEGASIATVGLPFKIIRGGGSLWFEARVKFTAITNTASGHFLGLMAQQTLSATVPIAAAGTLADNNFVGWHRLEGDGDQVDAVYKADGVTQVNVGTDLAPTALVAGTYVKLGMYYNQDSYDLKFYVDGVEVDSYNVVAAAGTDFPNDVQMGISLNSLSTTDGGQMELDWVRAAQLRV